MLDTASKGTLESEFGTSKDDSVIAQIMEKGDIQESEVCSNYCMSHLLFSYKF